MKILRRNSRRTDSVTAVALERGEFRGRTGKRALRMNGKIRILDVYDMRVRVRRGGVRGEVECAFLNVGIIRQLCLIIRV